MKEENKPLTETTELSSLKDAGGEELARAIYEILDSKKARDIQVLRVNDQTIITDYFVICTGNSTTQVKSLGDEVEYKLGLRGRDPIHYEGRNNGSWLVVDYASVILHVFNRESREFYQLEKLYGDAEKIAIESSDESDSSAE